MIPASVRVSMRAKLALPVTAAVLGLGLAGALIVRSSLERSLEQELARRAQALVSETALRATREALVDDVVGLDRVVDGAMRRDDVRYVVVIGPSGYVLSSSFPAGVPIDLIGIFESPRDAITSPVDFRTTEGVISDYVAQMIDGRLGTVHLGISHARIHAQARDRGRTVLLWGVGAAFLAALLAFGVAHLATRSVRQLADAAARLGGGDLSTRSGVSAKDEVGDLAIQFDTMAARLEENQERLETAHRQLLRTERLAVTGQVASGVAHEIGNPLHAARQFAEALRERPDDQGRYLPLIDEALTRIDRVIKQMLGFSSERAMEPRPTDASEVVEGALEFVRFDHRSRNVEFESAVGETVPAAMIDPDALHQVLVNLLVNALDALDGSGHIRVSVAGVVSPSRNGSVVITVRDDGPGIDRDLRAQVFEPFFTTKEVGEGTGLGLSVSQELLEAQGGRLVLQPDAGTGTTFEIWLPATEET